MSRFQDLQDDDTPSRGGGRGSRRSISVPPLIECEKVIISWRGEAPFTVGIYDHLNPNGAALHEFGEMEDTSVEWLVDLPLGREVIVRVEDDSGEIVHSDAQVILPGPNCPQPSSPALPQVFSTPTTRYQAFSTSFSSAVSVSSTVPIAVSTSITSSVAESIATSRTTEAATPSGTTPVTSSALKASSSTSSTSPAVQIITLTQTRPRTSRSSSSTDFSSLSSQDLVKSSDTPALTEKEGSKIGVAIGVTLGLGIPILLIFLAYFLHRRKSQQLEKPYANFSDLHSRPQSRLTSRSSTSFYSLGTDVLLPQVRQTHAQTPIIPPIPAVFGRSQRKGSVGSGSVASFGPGLPYEQREERLGSWDGYGYAYGRGGGSDVGESVYGGLDGRR